MFGGLDTYYSATSLCSLLFGNVLHIFTSARLESFLPFFCPVGAVFAIMGIVGGAIAKKKAKIAKIKKAPFDVIYSSITNE